MMQSRGEVGIVLDENPILHISAFSEGLYFWYDTDCFFDFENSKVIPIMVRNVHTVVVAA